MKNTFGAFSFFRLVILVLFLVVGKTLGFLSKLLKKGEGTSITGFLVERYCPFVIGYFNFKYQKIIYISGTNGKTTTRSILNSLLEGNHYTVASNRGGANILRGIASTLLKDLDWKLQPKSKILVLEVEEATLPKIKTYINPDLLVLTNLFRDQLDAYSEIDKTLEYFEVFIRAQLPDKLTIVSNGDDGKLVLLTQKLPEFNWRLVSVKEQINFTNFAYEAELSVPVNIDYQVDNLSYYRGELGFDFNKINYQTMLPGVYNVFNIALALATISELKSLVFKNTNSIISKIRPVFGRGEIFEYQKNNQTKKIFLFLVKNPAGFDLVLDHLANVFSNSHINLNIIVNDQIADSKDVSWLWDVNFEKYLKLMELKKVTIDSVTTTGSRANDILLRLQYANIKNIKTTDSINSLSEFVANLLDRNFPPKDQLEVVLATYTGMLGFRQELKNQGLNVPSINSQTS
jgi:lipid II isoglutaminyl synthase (glutamine-hydrolysing)